MFIKLLFVMCRVYDEYVEGFIENDIKLEFY